MARTIQYFEIFLIKLLNHDNFENIKNVKDLQRANNNVKKNYFFFSIWVFFYEHSRFTGQQGKGEGIYLTPLYHFHPLHRHLDISRAIIAESSP